MNIVNILRKAVQKSLLKNNKQKSKTKKIKNKMKKLLYILLLLLISCQPDELFEEEPIVQYEMIFEESQSSVTEGQEFSFEIYEVGKYQLIIAKNGSVITKETFLTEGGLNTRKIYTKSLPKEILKLDLVNPNGDIVKTTLIEII